MRTFLECKQEIESALANDAALWAGKTSYYRGVPVDGTWSKEALVNVANYFASELWKERQFCEKAMSLDRDLSRASRPRRGIRFVDRRMA